MTTLTIWGKYKMSRVEVYQDVMPKRMKLLGEMMSQLRNRLQPNFPNPLMVWPYWDNPDTARKEPGYRLCEVRIRKGWFSHLSRRKRPLVSIPIGDGPCQYCHVHDSSILDIVTDEVTKFAEEADIPEMSIMPTSSCEWWKWYYEP